jgi:hypothetical protein
MMDDQDRMAAIRARHTWSSPVENGRAWPNLDHMRPAAIFAIAFNCSIVSVALPVET